MEDIRALLESILADEPRRFTLSLARGGVKNVETAGAPAQKATLRPLGDGWQLERRTATQAFHQNLPAGQLAALLEELLTAEFRALHADTKKAEWNVKISKKGRLLSSRSAKASGEEHSAANHGASHDRQKKLILPEGRPIAPLVEMGLMTPEGRIVNAMRHKYRQINRFLEILQDELKREEKKSLRVVDFGCGKSYLTFVVYYYFTEVLGLEIDMLGLDLRADVVEKSRAAAEKHCYAGLRFAVGDIRGYAPEGPVDVVLCLHACDTATDYALANAVSWRARHIFAVPCCQHELSAQMGGGEMSILSRYGIIKERAAALFTDAIRANLLMASGYRAQILEFVDFDDTPKNLLIRAGRGGVSREKRQEALEEVRALCAEYGLSPTLYALLHQGGCLCPEEISINRQGEHQ